MPVLYGEYRDAKLRHIVEVEGYPSLDTLLADVGFDTVCPGICMAEGCDCTVEVEPEQEEGWCHLCGGNTVASALVLAGIL